MREDMDHSKICDSVEGDKIGVRQGFNSNKLSSYFFCQLGTREKDGTVWPFFSCFAFASEEVGK